MEKTGKSLDLQKLDIGRIAGYKPINHRRIPIRSIGKVGL